ncbi:MAG: hypothetical protein QXQ69_03175 [Candidatus Aenigmatarchaeota archaeon]
MKVVKFLKGYFKPLPLLGGLLGSGALYWAGFCVGFLKESIPNLLPSLASGNYHQLFYNSFQTAYNYAAQLGLIGGISGTILTRHGLDYLGKKIWKKKEVK